MNLLFQNEIVKANGTGCGFATLHTVTNGFIVEAKLILATTYLHLFKHKKIHHESTFLGICTLGVEYEKENEKKEGKEEKGQVKGKQKLKE